MERVIKLTVKGFFIFFVELVLFGLVVFNLVFKTLANLCEDLALLLTDIREKVENVSNNEGE
jgi:hypothetical protein